MKVKEKLENSEKLEDSEVKKNHRNLISSRTEATLEEYVDHCEVLLGAGKGHLGVINYLRQSGVDPEQLDSLSREVFAKANQRLYRSQLPLRIIAGSLVLLGILVPVAFYVISKKLPIITIVPLFMGLFVRTKVLRPEALPEVPAPRPACWEDEE